MKVTIRKGGDILHFRHLLISGLVIGAAMFLPDNAFAEKNELSGQQNSQKVSGQVEMDNAAVKPNILAQEKAVVIPEAVKPNVPAKEKTVAVPEAVKPSVPAKEKAVMVPDPAMKNQGGVKQQPSKGSPNNPTFQKPGAASHNLPDQAKGNVKSALNKTEKAVKAHESKKGTAVQENNNGLRKNTPTPESGSGNSALDSLHNSETKVKNQIQSIRVEPQEENTHLSMPKEENLSKSLVPRSQEKGDIPSGEKEIPKISQGPNPTQRTSGHGGPSNDRVSQGLNTISFLDKWFTWNPYYEIQFVQPYLSQHTWLNNQWVNAPPSPPPQKAPLLETVTRS